MPRTAASKVESLPGKWQGDDPVFFHRSQIRRGVRLLWFGRTHHGTMWEVVDILTTEHGRRRAQKVDAVDRLRDQVVLQRLGSNQYRQTTFAYLSYAATWRLA